MDNLMRLSLCAATAVVMTTFGISLVVKIGGPRLEEHLNIAMWSEKLCEELRRAQELHLQAIPVFRRTIEKRRIVQDLIGHRITLVEAVRLFRELNDQVREVQPTQVARVIEMGQNQKAICRNVINYVQAELADEPAYADEVTDELEREMRELE